LPGYQYRHNDRFRTDNGEFLSTMCISATGSTDWRLRR
jgi:hypothetical protein